MNSTFYPLVMILTIAAVTALLRFIPFFVFGRNKKVPEYINYLGKVLPYAIMSMLVIYCLRSVSFTSQPFGIPELISTALVVLLHVWKRNTLFSIIGGTVCYMILIQFIF